MISPGERLRVSLSERGVSGYRLSKLTGMSQTHIGDILNRGRRITVRSSLKLGKALGISARDIYSWQMDWDLWLGIQEDSDA